MEVVPDELVLRYEKLRSSDSGEGVDGCAICHEGLVDEAPASDTAEAPPASPGPSVAFPCTGKHLFHTECLLPWLKQNTTCPSCRFNIDPLRMSWRRPLSAWQSPQVESMRDWLAAEEEAKAAGVRRVRPDVVMPEYPAPSPRTSPDSGLDPDTLSLDFSDFGDLDTSTLTGESGVNFERDFAAWFNPGGVNSVSL
ncbi:hypothetical protein V8D89_005113 [Ganoderma adspersum]